MTHRTPLIAVALLALATGASEATGPRVRAPQASAQTPQALNAADGYGHRQSGPEACRQAAISTLRAWGNPVENLAMAMIEGGADAWFVRIDDLTRLESWRSAVALGVCTARQEDGFWRVEAFSLRPANDPAADCVTSMTEAGRRLQAAQVRIDGTLQGRDGQPAEIAATLLDAQGRVVASGACPLLTTPEGAFMIAPGRIETSRR
jgi:hypothetical protein